MLKISRSKIPASILEVCDQIHRDRIGSCMLVGGAVCDLLLGKEPKDWDIEVFGCSMDQLRTALEDAGIDTRPIGKSYGILAATNMGLDVDFSIPRRDNRVGVGHRDFECEFDPSMGIVEAAKRRDFTIDSMSYDILREELVDPYNGLVDLVNGVLKIVARSTFIEDPLRAMRGMQIMARKAPNRIDADSAYTISLMLNDIEHLPGERILAEFDKLLMDAEKPSIGMRYLQVTKMTQAFPELHCMINCNQNPAHHPEGDVWEHTLLAMDCAASVKHFIPYEWRRAFMYAMMLHDCGKPLVTTEDYKTYDHHKVGAEVAEKFMIRLKAGKDLTSKTVALVENHMYPILHYNSKAGVKVWRKLNDLVPLAILGLFNQCDHCGRIPLRCVLGEKSNAYKTCEYYSEKFAIAPFVPKVMGRDLLNHGIQPGPLVGDLMRRCKELQMDDPALSTDELLCIVGVISKNELEAKS